MFASVGLTELVLFDFSNGVKGQTANHFWTTVTFYAVGIWSASESTVGIMIASLPAAYQMFKCHRQQPSRPQSPPGAAPATGGAAGRCAGCCDGDHNGRNLMIKTSSTPGRGLRRRHSISIDTSTAGKCSADSTISPRSFMTATVGDDSDTIELASPTRAAAQINHHLPCSPECACGRAWPKPGEYLGMSERCMASQDVSVRIPNSSGEGTTTLSPEKARYYI